MGKKFGKTAVSLVLALAISGLMQISALAADLIPVGKAVGIRVTIDGVMVAGISEVETAEGKCSPAAQSGVLPGDIIVKLGSEEVHCLEEFSGAAKQLTDDPISLTVLREGERKQFTITPVLAMLPAFIVLGCAIPAVMYRQAVKQSIVERLRSLDT